MNDRKIYLLLPAYNEENALPSLLSSIPHKLADLNYEVVVVDDGSSDRTAAVAGQYPVTLLRHEKNKGLGSAMKTGFDHITRSAGENDLIVAMDADDTHDSSLILEMMKKIPEFDIVIASRYCPGGRQTGVGFVRAALSRLMSKTLKIVFPVNGAQDYSSGYRAYRAGIVKNGIKTFGNDFIQSSGFACMPEILVKLASLGSKVTEVPLVMHYEFKKSGSKFRPVDLIIGYFRLFVLLKRAVSRIK